MDDAADFTSDDRSKGKTVGLLIATVWSELIKHVLPVGTNGAIFVFGNPCDQVFTYRIDGPNGIYLGPGDWHDAGYDHFDARKQFPGPGVGAEAQ